MFAEGTVTKLHVGEFVFILDKESATVFTHSDRYVRHHVLEVALGEVRTIVTHILYEDLFESHALQHVACDSDGLVRVLLLILILKENLCEKIVLNSLIVIVHAENLFLFGDPLVPAATTITST